MLNNLIKITNEIRKAKYPEAEVIFLAGSLVRGEGTSTSDLDLVVVFSELRSAYRDSYFYPIGELLATQGEMKGVPGKKGKDEEKDNLLSKKLPIEAFVHDPQTLEYFFRKVDAPTGYPSLPSMVAEGIEVPAAGEFSGKLKQMAKTVLEEGPPQWTRKDIDQSRYMITDLVEDLKAPRSNEEMQAIATVLYPVLANHFFRRQNIWSAKGKTIPRRLKEVNPGIAGRFLESFNTLFTRNQAEAVIDLATEILTPDGGFLFEGYKLEAPESWRLK